MAVNVKSVTWGAWGGEYPGRPVSANMGDGVDVSIPAAFEDPAFLRELADIIEAGPTPDQIEVAALVRALRENLDETPEEHVQEIARGLWRSGVRAR